VDPLPFKTCNHSCVYCQLGRTRLLTRGREELLPVESILAEVEQALAAQALEQLDCITIVGSGEPTLHCGLGSLLRGIKAMTDIPLAVISNGSLLHRPSVREDLLVADTVLPSLDAGSEDVFRRINCPHCGLSLARLLEGLVCFRNSYHGSLQIEVMLVAGINDTRTAVSDLATALARVQPDEVHISVPSRPPAEAWVRPPDTSRLRGVRCDLARFFPYTLPKRRSAVRPILGTVEETLLAIIRRHPMRACEAAETMGAPDPAEVRNTLRELERNGHTGSVARFGHLFWGHARAWYGLDPRMPP